MSVGLGLPERIESKISPEPNSGCWLWTGALVNGYGNTWFEYRTQPAHVVIFKLLRGPVPEGLQLDHMCRMRCCCNPDHVEPVTQAVNIARGEGVTARKQRQTHCKNGHEFTPENTYVFRTSRRCATCHRNNEKLRYHEKRR